MSATTWQVRIGKKLSKPYTVDQLRKKHNSGAVDDSTECSPDSGDTFIPLSELLQDDLLNSSARRLKRATPLRKQRPVEDDVPAFAEIDAGRAAANELLADLYAASSNAVAQESQRSGADEYVPVYNVPEPDAAVRAGYADLWDEPTPRPTAVAAAKALEKENRGTDESSKPPVHRSKPAAVATVLPEPEAGIADPEPAGVFVSRKFISVLLAGLCVAAIGFVAWRTWASSASTSLDGLTGGVMDIAKFNSADPVSLDQLDARTQILGIQIGRITKALTAQRDTEIEMPIVELPEFPQAKKLPLLAFRPRKKTESEAAKAEDYRSRYSKLVSEKGPDGRKLDATSVARQVVYLSYLAENVDSTAADRPAALYELSEWTKLMYLLQLGRLSSADSVSRDEGRAAILNASNGGLHAVYSELRAGDMRFADVFERSVASEQSRLVLTRYWYHRSIDRAAADEWLNKTLEMLDESEHEFVRQSIAEANQIEG